MRLFPPVVTGTVITVLGIVLIPVGLNDAAGGLGSPDFGEPKNFAYAGGTMLFILVLMKIGKPFLSSIAILLGLVAGTAVASCSATPSSAAWATPTGSASPPPSTSASRSSSGSRSS